MQLLFLQSDFSFLSNGLAKFRLGLGLGFKSAGIGG